MSIPIQNHKQICRAIAPDGWQYTGYFEGFYYFQTGTYARGFKEMKCLAEDLTAENLALMTKMGITR